LPGPESILAKVYCPLVPNIWLRPTRQRREADAAKALLTVPDGDHLTLLDIFNKYMLSKYVFNCFLGHANFFLALLTDKPDKSWAWTNYLSQRALQEAENVRAQLQRTMERFQIDLITLNDTKKLFINVRKTLVAGFFMQVAHKVGKTGNYLIVKDGQACH
jgi:pre-mRNA-splicing factor ATP-dependent RNA helicase DHX15/PRP43